MPTFPLTLQTVREDVLFPNGTELLSERFFSPHKTRRRSPSKPALKHFHNKTNTWTNLSSGHARTHPPVTPGWIIAKHMSEHFVYNTSIQTKVRNLSKGQSSRCISFFLLLRASTGHPSCQNDYKSAQLNLDSLNPLIFKRWQVQIELYLTSVVLRHIATHSHDVLTGIESALLVQFYFCSY